MLHHSLVLAALCTVVVVVAVTMAAPGASAQAAGVECDGIGTVSYDPGLLLTPQTVTFHVTYSYDSCDASDPKLTSGTTSTPPEGRTAELSCLNLLGASDGVASIDWNNGSFSRYAYFRSTNTVAGQLITVETGTVIEGAFLGSDIEVRFISLSLDALSCLLGPGITSRSGDLHVTIG